MTLAEVDPGASQNPEIHEVYARFVALMELHSDPGGSLLLYSRLDREGIALAIASNVAGLASLGIEPEAARAKSALRTGVCDFVVINLDEALRILKNEIRKRRPVSVALLGDLNSVLLEITERGVQPDAIAFPFRELIERGARLVPQGPATALPMVEWSVERELQNYLPVLDSLALKSLDEKAPMYVNRLHWLEASPRYLGRGFAGQRLVGMTDAETSGFITGVRAAVQEGSLPDAVRIWRHQP